MVRGGNSIKDCGVGSNRRQRVEISGFFTNSVCVTWCFSWGCLVREGMWCFAENRHLRGRNMVRKNISRTPQIVRECSYISMPCNSSLLHWSLLVFILEKNAPKNSRYTGWLWPLPVTHKDSAEPCCFCWIVPQLLIHIWCLLLNWTAGILTMKGEIAPKELLLNRCTTTFSY